MPLMHWVLRNSMLLNLLTVFVMGLGVMAALEMRRSAFPEVDFDLAVVSTVYPGASPREVEADVTDKIEDELEEVSGIKEFVGVSYEGYSLITVTLDPDQSERKKNKVIADVQQAVERTQDLPDSLPEPPLVDEVESGDMPVIEVAMTGDMPYATLHTYADQLADRLEAISDISEVDRRGYEDEEFWVEIDQRRLDRNQVPLELLIGRLASRNMNVPGGALKSPDGELLVRTIGEVSNAEAIGDVVLRANDAGRAIRVRDVASVKATYEDATRLYRTNGTPSINMLVMKSSDGDIIRLVDKVKAETQRFQAGIDDGRLKISHVNDVSFFVKRRLGVLINNGALGIGLVLLGLFLFLSKSIALVAAAGLPIAFLGTFLVMGTSGMTINLISMFGLIIVLGLLVDDAIIVAENIWQHYEAGESALSATTKGVREVFWPVTATILTTVAAFSPMLMVGGIFGKFLAEMPKVVIVALAASLIEAMLILPLHAYDMLKWREGWRRRRARARGADAEAAEQAAHPRAKPHRLLDPTVRGYERLLRGVLKLRYLFILLILGVFGFSLWWSQAHMQTILFPSEGVEAFFVRADQPIGTSLETTAERMQAIERAVETLDANELMDYVTTVGVQQNDPQDPFTERGSHLAQIAVYLTGANERKRTAKEIINALRAPVEQAAEQAGFERVVFEQVQTGPPIGKPVAIRVEGENLQRLDVLADDIAEKLATYPGVSDIDKDFRPGKDELKVTIDEAAAARMLLSVEQIARQIRTVFAGTIASHVRKDGEQVPIRVRFPKADRQRRATLENLKLANSAGMLIPLRRVASFERAPGLTSIIHRDTHRTVTVTAALDEKITSSQATNEAIRPYLEDLETAHPGIMIETGGEYEDTQEGLADLRKAFFVALGLILLILAGQFRSLTQPLVVAAAIPFGLTGVIWAFYFHGLPLSFIGMIGAIGLTGVIVNDSIVLVDFINKARERGSEVREAVVYAARRRFRAVWLTTITTIAGVLPLVYGIGGTDPFLRPAAIALGYGLLFGTVLILLFVPSMYVIRADIAGLLGKWLDALLRLGGGKAPAPPTGGAGDDSASEAA